MTHNHYATNDVDESCELCHVARAFRPLPAPPVHTIGGKPIGPDNPGEYGRTHDMSCPGCADTPFTASPRSETYWSS